MNSPDSELRQMLQGLSISVIGFTEVMKPIRIYDRVPETLSYPYIHIQDITNTDDFTKEQTIWDTEILFDVVTAFEGQQGGRKLADAIGNSLLTALLDSPYKDLGTFQIIKGTVLNMNYVDEDGGDNYIIRKLIRVQLMIELEMDYDDNSPIVTLPTSSVTHNSATVGATLDCNGLATTWSIEYGTTTAYGTTILGGTTTVNGAKSSTIQWLPQNTLIYWRFKAVSPGGTSYSAGQTLRTYNDEVADYVTGLTTPLSSAQISKLNIFVWAIKDGLSISALSDAFDIMRILAGETEESSLKNLVKDAHHATAVNSPTFTQFEGFEGNASTMAIKDNYIPSTEAVKFTLNSGSFGAYGRKSVTVGAKTIMGAATAATGSSGLQTKVTTTVLRYTINSGRITSTINSTVAAALNVGMHIVNRVLSTEVNYYRNKINLSTIALNSDNLVTFSTAVLANSTANDVYSMHTNEQAAFEFWGRGLTQGEINAITDAIEAYMDSNEKGVIT